MEAPNTADLRSHPLSSSALPKVIIGGTPLLGELTGIGHYTRQLVTALQTHQLVSQLRLWGDVSFIDGAAVLTTEGARAGLQRDERAAASGSSWKQTILMKWWQRLAPLKGN